ncbi:MAG TPA: TfuA-like protein [Polyangiaceae bacterium]
MSSVVFSGPSLEASAARELLPRATFLGPAACGDVYLASKLSPPAIAIIDGYFDHRLPVWHKEILWVLSRGIPVYGASSMGALRAAELAEHGMVGVGSIYEQFQSGELEDDDEVAVLHEPPERNYRARSEAMVNIRATLRAAWAAGVIDSGAEAAVVAAAKSLFYADRSFDAALEGASELRQATRIRLKKWVSANGVVDQKRADAMALLRRLRDDLEHPSVHQPKFRFSHTNYWQTLRHSLDHARSESARPESAAAGPFGRGGAARWLENLRARDASLHQTICMAALERAFALELARQVGVRVSPNQVQQASERFRREHGLLTPEATSRWLAQNSLDLAGFSELSHDQVLVDEFADRVRAAILEQLPSALRALGLFEEGFEAASGGLERRSSLAE